MVWEDGGVVWKTAPKGGSIQVAVRATVADACYLGLALLPTRIGSVVVWGAKTNVGELCSLRVLDIKEEPPAAARTAASSTGII